MPRCGDCEYFREPDSKYGKGECTWYNNEYYPDESSCSHFRAGRSASCGSCEYFRASDSRYSKGESHTITENIILRKALVADSVDLLEVVAAAT